MAVIGEGIEDETRATWFYELAVVSVANKDYCDAIAYAKEAIAYKSDYGKAYLILGDAIVYSRTNLGDDFAQRTAFWVAADKYTKAKSVDPSVSADANKKIRDYAGQYPNNEEVFFRDLKDGDSYQVKGCINEYTTVRSRKE
jgi:tetratricopeptide (TPR) repeat protein